VLEGLRIKTKLDGFRLPVPTISATSTPRSRFSRQVAAAVLAIGVQASLPIGAAMAQPAPVPLQQAGGNQEKCCSLSGIVTDPAAAVVQNVTITIRNLATRGVITVKTDDAGQFTAKDLPAGKYNVTAVLDGFKTTTVNGIEVTEGTAARVNIRLELGNWGGCCEYAAAPMRAPADYAFKTTPFIYSVGESDDRGTLKGIAKLVYGDQKRWIQIYEANRDKVTNPNALSYGMALTIPGSREPEPKLETKVLPTYPPEATRQHIHGEVAMDVTLNDDGTVRTLKVIEGNPLLDSAAADAVKQWKYRPPTAHDKLVNKFVVVLTFDRNGKLR